MDPSIRVVSCLAVMVLIGSVYADPQSGGNISHRPDSESAVDRPPCPIATVTEENTRNLLSIRLNYCFKSPNNGTDLMEGLLGAETADDIRSFFRRFCGMQTFARQCAANIRALSELCLNETQRDALQIHGNFVQLAYETGCAQGGEKAANAIVDGWQLNNGSLDSVIYACVHSATNHLVLRRATDVTVVSRQNYRFLRAFKECLVSTAPRGSSLVKIADVIIGDILEVLPCIDRYRVTVLCETMDYI